MRCFNAVRLFSTLTKLLFTYEIVHCAEHSEKTFSVKFEWLKMKI